MEITQPRKPGSYCVSFVFLPCEGWEVFRAGVLSSHIPKWFSYTEARTQSAKGTKEEIHLNIGYDFPGVSGLKNPPSNAGDAGSISDLGTKIPHATGQINQFTTTRERATTEAYTQQWRLNRAPTLPPQKKKYRPPLQQFHKVLEKCNTEEGLLVTCSLSSSKETTLLNILWHHLSSLSLLLISLTRPVSFFHLELLKRAPSPGPLHWLFSLPGTQFSW